ncbi:PTS glucose transporter subunit IIA [Enterococcus hirae]|jgi:PTS system glucose-specific IIA component|uniref:PTS sugar transporter subunit IIA n=1 Tax=Enterococcus hirae TaxID=1354 RepID=UPI0010E519D6|nr:PTS glucose transporter subunit IIA [Enterococcus hirae]MBS6193433.1 PTS glucose transporter subunit IIA [Enterococcus hirae]MDQ2183314.1 PTS glucose transporter subunit IIA [Enterococcus hirae]VTS75986.1 PTS system transporter subunit IIA [Enterococcus hirae]
MFQFLKKKKQEIIHAPCSGQVIPITEVKDPVFSQKLLGDGFAIIPNDEKITVPITGQVLSVFPTKHAISFRTEEGLEYLIHIGVDTVKLQGAPFTILIKENDMVNPGDIIAEVDFNQIIKARKDPSVIVVFTENNQVKNLSLNKKFVENGNTCGKVNF